MKYQGSKSRIAKYIVPIIQSYIDKMGNECNGYWEPFVGGANVIDKIECPQKYGSDLNKYLIALLKHVRDGGLLYEEVSKNLYNTARNAYNNGVVENFQDWQIGNIGFLASYNGRFFDGGYAKPGYEKTKTGVRYRDYYKEAKNNLLEQAPKLKDIIFCVSDYKNPHPMHMVIYVDPPYQGTKEYSNSHDFDYDVFWDTMRKWSENNIVIISEEHAPIDFSCVWEKPVSRSIKASDKSTSVEKLFVVRGGYGIK